MRDVQHDLFGVPMDQAQSGPSLQLDDWGGRTIRRLMVRGEPWWVLADVARVLGYRDARDAGRLLREKRKGTHLIRTPGGEQTVLIIDEPGLYRLMMRSNHSEAEAFQDWITDEVLPSIRKYGFYSTRGGRIPRWSRRLKTDDPATVQARIELADLNRELNRRLADRGFKPVDFAAYHNAHYEAMTGKNAKELREDLGLKGYQSPLDRMGPVALSLNQAIKNMARQFIEDFESDLGRALARDEYHALVDRATDAILGACLARLEFTYTLGLRPDPDRGLVLDLIRRSIGPAV